MSSDVPASLLDDLFTLSRLSLTGTSRDVELFVRRIAKKIKVSNPDLSERLMKLSVSQAHSPARGAVAEIPVDTDSRLQLLRREMPAGIPDPIWRRDAETNFSQVIEERLRVDELVKANLTPTKSMLLTGPPGVGKTLTARWIASQLGMPLFTLDLSAVMSSFLGRTGNNLRNVIDYAKGAPCVLLLDEFDAVAKRRDDAVEVGELKRLVTVLLQEIELWPSEGFLLAATNHPELLDPAVWRRFDTVVEFDLPNTEAIGEAIERFLGDYQIDPQLTAALSPAFEGMSFSDIQRDLTRARREAVLTGDPLPARLQEIVRRRVDNMTTHQKKELARQLIESGHSQVYAHKITGLARDTIRAELKKDKE